MAMRWSSEFASMEYRDLQAGTMAVDSTGEFVLLAGRRFIAVKNLDNTEVDSMKKFPRQSKYEVGASQWNPTAHNRELCVISCNQRLEILRWTSSDLHQEHSIKAHTRVISDLNWHRNDPNALVSCSVDTFIHVWDIRDVRRPVLSLSAVAEATQVRWNRVSDSLLATAHDGDIKVWDRRRGTQPVQYIAAHLTKIYGLDWHPRNERQLATCGQDGTVKFFDIDCPRRAEFAITTACPVWRARYTPFGEGVVTVVVPQLRRGENSLLLWNLASRSSPVHTFVGHTDVVLEFEWRKKRDSDYQLITWARDQTLRVWRIDPYLQKLCGHDSDDESLADDHADDGLSTSAGTVGSEKDQQSLASVLQQEFSLVNINIQNIEFIKMDAGRRTCTVRASSHGLLVVLQVSFPPTYPFGAVPSFLFGQDTSVDEAAQEELSYILQHTAQQRVSKSRGCLEPCLRQLVATLDRLSLTADAAQHTTQMASGRAGHGSFGDAYIPFPRTSGARFCSVGTLVCFGRPPHARRLSSKAESTTPRALSALGSQYPRASNSDHPIIVSSFYFNHHTSDTSNARSRSHSRRSFKPPPIRPVVTVYDASGLFLVQRSLGELYTLEGETSAVCRYNAEVAKSVGRWDLVQAWTLASLVTGYDYHQYSTGEDETPWVAHPFGRRLIQSLIDHYAAQADLQMAAMLCCVFGPRHLQKQSQPNEFVATPRHRKLSANNENSAGASVYHTIPPTLPHRTSSFDNLSYDESRNDPIPELVKVPTVLHDSYKLAYAEVLHRWNLLYAKAQVLKQLSVTTEPHNGVEFLTDCQHCQQPGRGAQCTSCKKLSLCCIICHVSVRGSANFCLVCGHGGHTQHLLEWFSTNEICPTGCGCYCLSETASVLQA